MMVLQLFALVFLQFLTLKQSEEY